VERPSCSTSGGQSEGSEREDVAAAGGVEGETLSLEPGAERAMAIHEETEVQERHLRVGVSGCFCTCERKTVHTACRPGLEQLPWVMTSSHHPARCAGAAPAERPRAGRAIR
jgi:hypothetical protein